VSPAVRRFLLILVTAAVVSTPTVAASAPSWLVRVGPDYIKVGEYRIGSMNTQLDDVIDAFGEPTSCRVIGKPSHVQATWAGRGLWGDFWTFGLMPTGENGCISPDLIHVSELRLRDPRWHTAVGLRVGDTTVRLRKLYPHARYERRTRYRPRDEYWLASERRICFGDCGGRRYAPAPLLTAEVRRGKVVALWVPVRAQGE
jgi:hypothetical protein